MKKYFSEHSKTVQWMICTALTFDQVSDVIKVEENDPMGGIDVEFRVNGIDIDLTYFLNKMDALFDAKVLEMAEDIAIKKARSVVVSSYVSSIDLIEMKNKLMHISEELETAIYQIQNRVEENEEGWND